MCTSCLESRRVLTEGAVEEIILRMVQCRGDCWLLKIVGRYLMTLMAARNDEGGNAQCTTVSNH